MSSGVLTHNLSPFFPELSQHDSSKELKDSPLYQQLLPEIQKIFSGYEIGEFASPLGQKNSYRAVTWNLERGICFEGIVETLKNNPNL